MHAFREPAPTSPKFLLHSISQKVVSRLSSSIYNQTEEEIRSVKEGVIDMHVHLKINVQKWFTASIP